MLTLLPMQLLAWQFLFGIVGGAQNGRRNYDSRNLSLALFEPSYQTFARSSDRTVPLDLAFQSPKPQSVRRPAEPEWGGHPPLAPRRRAR